MHLAKNTSDFLSQIGQLSCESQDFVLNEDALSHCKELSNQAQTGGINPSDWLVQLHKVPLPIRLLVLKNKDIVKLQPRILKDVVKELIVNYAADGDIACVFSWAKSSNMNFDVTIVSCTFHACLFLLIENA